MHEEENIKQNFSNAPEEDLIILAKKDLDYFSFIYNRYHNSIFRFVLRKTDDEDLTADIVSEVFLKAMLALHRFIYNGIPYQVYLMKIARNEVLAHYNRTRRRMVIAIEDMDIREVLQQETELNLDTAEVARLIEYLNEEEISILELKFFEGKAFYEIAYILDKGESAVKMRFYRALQKLKDKVKIT